MSIAGKQVLVTGADGFIGSHLTELLLKEGATVRALAWYHPQQNDGWLSDVSEHSALEIVRGDIRDGLACRNWVRGCDIVFHLAALIGIPYSYEAPQSYLDTNITGTYHLLEACREFGASLLFMSTSEVYGTAQQVLISESHPLQPQSPYSASKIGAEALVRSYFHSFGLPVVVARVFNTYGPRQSTRAILPTIITQLASGADHLKLGNLDTSRDLVFVKDTCQALVNLMESERAIGHCVNVCTGAEVRMADLVDLVQRLMGTQVPVLTDAQRVRPGNSEVYRLCGDADLLRSLTGSAPATTLREGLETTISWFRDHFSSGGYQPDRYHV